MRKWLLSPTLLLVITMLACSQQSTAPDPVTDTSGSSTEIPRAVQEQIDRYVVQDEDLLASMDSHTDPNSNLNGHDYDVYAVTFLWGTFFPNGSSTGLSWDGRTGTNAEAHMRLVTAISFEDGEDHIVEVDNPGIIAWRSFAHDDIDGISFLLYVKRGIDYFVAPHLVFESEQIDFRIPVHNLARHRSFHPVDHNNGVAVFARKIRHLPCSHGHVVGQWTFDSNDRSHGRLEGRWLDVNGNTRGHLTGSFGTTDDGQMLMRGEVSGVNTDEVILHLEGRWHFLPHLTTSTCLSCPHGGEFIARWRFSNGSGGGKVAARFGENTMTSDAASVPFRGIWKQHCDHVVTDSDWSTGSE